MMANLVFYSAIEVATAFAPNLTTFLVLRALFGIGMGGEWGVGASLVMEKVPARWRGVLSGLLQEGYAATFGNPTADPYLAKTLPSQGALLSEYYGTGHESNDNYISLVSGQPPNPDNQGDCLNFNNFAAPMTESNGVVKGVGCVFPPSTANIGTQLSSANALEVDRLAIAELDLLAKRFPPGMKYKNAFDTTDAVGESIRDALSTLIEAIVLVILVIFIFFPHVHKSGSASS